MVHSKDRKRASGITEKGTTGMMEHTEDGTEIKEAATKESMEQPVERNKNVVEQLLQPKEERGRNVDQTQNWNETMKKLIINEELEGPSRQSGNEKSEMVEHTEEEGSWQGKGPCTPCNSTVEAKTLTLPTVGFVCLEVPPVTHAHNTEEEEGWQGWEWNESVGVGGNVGVMDWNGRGLNITYELRKLWDLETIIGGLDHAYIGDCSYNGVPVLHQLNHRKYEFVCECGFGSWGVGCQRGGLCSLPHPATSCSSHGQCRYIGGESLCVCEEGYHGAICQHHYTTIPYHDTSCGGVRDCDHNCHLRHHDNSHLTFCSCRAGYVLVNFTSCLLIVYDTLGKLICECFCLEANKAVQEVVGSVYTNLTVNTRGDGVVVSKVGIVGGELATRLVQDSASWRQHFGPSSIHITNVPTLHIGPVTAWWSESVLMLTCPVRGGPDLTFTWLKDGTQVYSHHVRSCTYEDRLGRLHVMAEHGRDEYECTDVLWVTEAGLEERGTYECVVESGGGGDGEGWRASRQVIVGRNESLQLIVNPRVATVKKGENVIITCTTSNRGWASKHHYNVWWIVTPKQGYSHITQHSLHRRGTVITIIHVKHGLLLFSFYNVTLNYHPLYDIMVRDGREMRQVCFKIPLRVDLPVLALTVSEGAYSSSELKLMVLYSGVESSYELLVLECSAEFLWSDSHY
ncbi:hypothetical protein Pmani_016749 [Petrolisthes manimaculis]|uniref:Ig-like domain-containing protein n=1 Tax=Petrolisthes manimaculis TaxID=1843537 RepID=A0AAE1U637_9EUCA|nr:hypothetical protein Pmani_016749 [Petrolisthes manimaculis]